MLYDFVLTESNYENIKPVLEKTCFQRGFEFFKGALLGLRQFLAMESPLKMMKNTLYFTLKPLFVLFLFVLFKLLS